MHISCQATDHDGTLARDGVVDEATAVALHRLDRPILGPRLAVCG
jgi:hypothetical protein